MPEKEKEKGTYIYLIQKCMQLTLRYMEGDGGKGGRLKIREIKIKHTEISFLTHYIYEIYEFMNILSWKRCTFNYVHSKTQVVMGSPSVYNLISKALSQ